MPSTSPPDDADVFTADTLEEAMAAAVASHGPDLVVHSARRVRAGVRGLMGRETYEVVATPAAPASTPAAGPAAGPAADPVEAALAALLDDAEAREQAQPTPRTPRPKPAAARPKAVRSQPAAPRRQPEEAPAPAAPEPQPAPRVQHPLFPVVSRAPRPRPDAGDAADEPVAEVVGEVVGDVVAEPAAPRGDQAEEQTAVPPAFPRARRARPEVLEGVVEDGPDEPPARPAERRAPRKAKPPVRRATPHPDPAVAEHTTSGARSWSRARLRRLGVPAKVLSLLPAEDPRDDLAWLVALTGAIAATVPAPAEPSASTPAVVHGYELAGALAILDACSRGAHPGTLTTGGRTVPATPTELALLVRSHVLADDV